jgi:hypothetical protein
LHFNKAADHRCLVKAEDAFLVAEAHPPAHLAPIAAVTPLSVLAWMTVSGPACELVVEDVVQDLEVVFGNAVLEVVGPALNNRVEGVDQARLRRTTMLLNDVP